MLAAEALRAAGSDAPRSHVFVSLSVIVDFSPAPPPHLWKIEEALIEPDRGPVATRPFAFLFIDLMRQLQADIVFVARVPREVAAEVLSALQLPKAFIVMSPDEPLTYAHLATDDTVRADRVLLIDDASPCHRSDSLSGLVIHAAQENVRTPATLLEVALVVKECIGRIVASPGLSLAAALQYVKSDVLLGALVYVPRTLYMSSEWSARAAAAGARLTTAPAEADYAIYVPALGDGRDGASEMAPAFMLPPSSATAMVTVTWLEWGLRCCTRWPVSLFAPATSQPRAFSFSSRRVNIGGRPLNADVVQCAWLLTRLLTHPSSVSVWTDIRLVKSVWRSCGIEPHDELTATVLGTYPRGHHGTGVPGRRGATTKTTLPAIPSLVTVTHTDFIISPDDDYVAQADILCSKTLTSSLMAVRRGLQVNPAYFTSIGSQTDGAAAATLCCGGDGFELTHVRVGTVSVHSQTPVRRYESASSQTILLLAPPPPAASNGVRTSAASLIAVPPLAPPQPTPTHGAASVGQEQDLAERGPAQRRERTCRLHITGFDNGFFDQRWFNNVLATDTRFTSARAEWCGDDPTLGAWLVGLPESAAERLLSDRGMVRIHGRFFRITRAAEANQPSEVGPQPLQPPPPPPPPHTLALAASGPQWPPLTHRGVTQIAVPTRTQVLPMISKPTAPSEAPKDHNIPRHISTARLDRASTTFLRSVNIDADAVFSRSQRTRLEELCTDLERTDRTRGAVLRSILKQFPLPCS